MTSRSTVFCYCVVLLLSFLYYNQIYVRRGKNGYLCVLSAGSGPSLMSADCIDKNGR